MCKEENVSYSNDGLEAVIFTAQGDLRQVIMISIFVISGCIYTVPASDGEARVDGAEQLCAKHMRRSLHINNLKSLEPAASGLQGK